MARKSVSVGFAVAPEDQERLDRLAKRFADGNRSAFLRQALDQMEVIDRASRLQRIQAYGVQQAATRGISEEDVGAIVKRVLRSSHDRG
jgi:predicted transcriptional regulator